MFPQGARLTREDFLPLVKGGQFRKTVHFTARFLHAVDGKNDANTKCSVVVSSKTEALAVNRNRIKRRVREIAQKHCEKLRGGVKVVIFVQKGALELRHRELQNELQILFRGIV